MGNIAVSWYKDSDRVVLFDFPEKWEWTDFWDAKVEGDQLADSVTHNTAVILNVPDGSRIPGNTLSQSRLLVDKRHPRTTLIVLVTRNPFARNIMRVLSQLNISRRGMLQSATSLDEVTRILRQMGFVPPDDAAQ